MIYLKFVNFIISVIKMYKLCTSVRLADLVTNYLFNKGFESFQIHSDIQQEFIFEIIFVFEFMIFKKKCYMVKVIKTSSEINPVLIFLQHFAVALVKLACKEIQFQLICNFLKNKVEVQKIDFCTPCAKLLWGHNIKLPACQCNAAFLGRIHEF